ncbi:MAG: type IV toxin-antitoxin system AbiEi family antitoxin [Myxococcales bacterium]|nr:type IV toxin-antitoxin system AbiEi family antitoxin [Myxococcales bacterium]
MKGRRFIADLAARGRYHFTTEEVVRSLGLSVLAARAVLRRLAAKGEIATPYRGFHVIVPPEYRALNCLPPEQFVPQLMEHLREDYYVGLLSAAQHHGAAHQRPQVFQVMTTKNRPDIDCGQVHVVFVARRNAKKVPTASFNTPRGTMRVSTPEATALDLVQYVGHCGGIENAATVLAELAESIDPEQLARLAAVLVALPIAQRLGYLLEKVGAGDRTEPLAKLAAKRASHVTPLIPGRTMRGAPRDRRWRVAVNAKVEPEL